MAELEIEHGTWSVGNDVIAEPGYWTWVTKYAYILELSFSINDSCQIDWNHLLFIINEVIPEYPSSVFQNYISQRPKN